jgi:endonuclease/exonuclease/phosphatase family metal-dependent hydrolase
MTQTEPSGTDGARGTLGVATFNAFVGLNTDRAREDVRSLASVEGLDLIGWQEVNANPPGALGLPERGWETVQSFKPNSSPHELAVSWRRTEFTLVSSRMIRMHGDSNSNRGDDRSFPARWVLEVVLERTGPYPDLVTVLNTHVNHRIERWQSEPGRPFANTNTARALTHLEKLRGIIAAATSRYTVLLGDFNWNFVADGESRRDDLLHERLGDIAFSSWEALGLDGHAPSHPYSQRRIDYVFLSRRSPAAFVGQSVIEGLHSDHRPVTACIALR